MSRIVNETRLVYYTEKLWERIKFQLTDNTLKNAELLPNSTIVQFTKNNNQTVDVDLAKFMNRFYEVANMVEAENKKADCQNGDVIKVLDTNKTYLCVDSTKQNFNDAFIDITPQIINVGVTDVTYNDNTFTLNIDKSGQITPIDLSKLNNKINNVDPVDGNTNLDISIVGDDIVLSANGIEIDRETLTGYIKDTDLTKIGGDPQYADKIPQLGADGKLHGTMMPDLAITSVNNVAGTQEALNKVQDGSIQVGDVVVVAPNNEIYMYNGANGGTFEDNFIQLSLGDGTVKEVNGQRPAANGQVVVTSSDISYDKTISGLQSDTVKEAIDELNGKFIEDVTYDEARNRTIFKTKGGQRDITVVEGLVTRWKHLEHVNEYPYINLFDIAKGQQGKQYGTNGQIVNSTQNWYIVEVDVEENTEYTLMKMHSYSNGYKVVFFNSNGTYHSEDNNNAPASNGWHRKTVRTPQGVTKVGLQFQYGIPQLPRAKETMFLRGNVTENINPFIPFADGNLIQVLKDISLEFDNSNSNLKSTTVESAIKEVNSRFTTTVKSVNDQLPNDLGNVTVDATQINTVNGGSVENELYELSIRKADKYGNSFISDLTVEDIKITGNPIATIRSNVTTGSAGTKTLAGDKNTFVRVGTKVSKILVGVNGYSEGETVTGVEVYAVKRDDNTIFERIVYEGTGVARIPKGETDGVLYVDVEVNKSFTEEVYFIARLKRNGNKGLRLGGIHTSGIAFDKTSDDQELQQGSVIPIGTSTTKIPNMLIYGETSLSNAIVNVELNNTNRLDFKKANGSTQSITIPTGGGTGTVNTVNNQPSIGGNVTVNAEHIGYTDTNNLGVDKVQGAIDNLANKTANIVNDIAYSNVDKTLTVTKNGVQQLPPIDLSSLVGITSINTEQGVDGAITLDTEIVGDNIQFKVDTNIYKELECYTDQDAATLIATFI